MDPMMLPLLATLLQPPPPTLYRAASFTKHTTICELTDGAIRLEVSPRSMVRDGYDSQMRCAQLRCLLDTGESCWP